MGKIRRRGFVFITWTGDHDPRHVHVMKNGKEVLKWNLITGMPMRGNASKRLRKAIQALVEEGKL